MLDDRLFVALARKAGYPTEEALRRCRATQLEWAKDGNRVSLLDVCFAQGALDEKQLARYERWAAQVARADQGPIRETVAAAAEPRVVHESAATFAALPPACSKCGRDLDDLGVLDGKVHVTVSGKKVCGACYEAVPVRTPSRKGVVAATKKLLQSSKDHLVALVRRPRRDLPAATSHARLYLLVGIAVTLAGIGAAIFYFTRSPEPGPRHAVPVPAPAPAPTPAPVPVPAPVPDAPPSLEDNASFREARDLYARAEELYRSSFAGKTPAEKKGLRDSRALLEKARGLLDKIPPRSGDAGTFDALHSKVSSLLRDVEKRQGATGS